MASKKQGYKVTVAGPGHNFERDIDEMIASQIISLAMTGKASTGSDAGAAGSNDTRDLNASSHGSPQASQVRGSLASHIKAKKGDKNQNTRFLATAQWLSDRSGDYGQSGRASLIGP